METLQRSLSSLATHGAQTAPIVLPGASACSRPQSCLLLRPSRSSTSSLRGGCAFFSHSFLLEKIEEQAGASIGSARVQAMAKNVASGYAGALAEIGQSSKTLDFLYEDMEKLGNYLQDKQLANFINNPVVKIDHKKAVMKELAKEARFQPPTVNLLNLIIDRKRTGILNDLIKEFEGLYNDLTNTQVAIVKSAIPLQKAQLSWISKKVQSMSNSKNVKLKNVIDKSVIAGFVLNFGKDGSRLIDVSVKGQLDRITTLIDASDPATVLSS